MFENAGEGAHIPAAGGVAGGRCAVLPGGDQLQRLRARVSEAMCGEAQEAAGFRRGGQDAADQVMLLIPQVKGAAAMVGGKGVLGGVESEEDTAVLKQRGIGEVSDKLLDDADDFFGRLRGSGRVNRGRSLDRHRGTLRALAGRGDSTLEVVGVGGFPVLEKDEENSANLRHYFASGPRYEVRLSE